MLYTYKYLYISTYIFILYIYEARPYLLYELYSFFRGNFSRDRCANFHDAALVRSRRFRCRKTTRGKQIDTKKIYDTPCFLAFPIIHTHIFTCASPPSANTSSFLLHRRTTPPLSLSFGLLLSMSGFCLPLLASATNPVRFSVLVDSAIYERYEIHIIGETGVCAVRVCVCANGSRHQLGERI